MFYLVWSEDEYFEEIVDNKRNFKVGNNPKEIAELYFMDNEGYSDIYVIEARKAKKIIDQMRDEGFFTKEMEDEIFINSSKFHVSVGLNLELET